MNFIYELLDVIYPRRCVVCDKALTGRPEIGLCAKCFKFLKAGFSSISYALQGNAFFEKAYAAFSYEGVIKECIHSFKYKSRRDLAKPLGSFLSEALRNAPFVKEARLLIPVPLHKSRLAERGYNQSELLAKEVSRSCGIKLSQGNLIRIKKGKNQVGLAKEERLLNVRGIFKLKHAPLIKGMNIILVDDIMTTGATINECARLLKECGASSVNALVLAIGI